MAVIESAEIQLRATATGVKQGLAVAQAEFKKLNERKKELEEDLKLKINAPELVKLRDDLKALQEKKKELETAIRFPVDTENVQFYKKFLQEIEQEKAALEEEIKITIKTDPEAYTEAYRRIEELKNEQKSFAEGLNIAVKADTDAAKKALEDVKKQMSDVERKIAIEADTQGVEKAKTELKELSGEMRNVQAEAKAAESHFPAIAAAAAVAFAAITKAINVGVKEFNSYTAAMNGLASQMEHAGVSMGAAMDVVKDKTSDGLISESDIAVSIKNLTSYGFSIQQTDELLERLKDSAAYNRQAHYSLGEAVRVTTEGIKNENSTLADAAGVTKNIAKMYEDYAKSLGVTANSLTQAQKAQAVFNGIMAETEATMGNAARYSKELAGAQAEQAAQATKLAQAYGEAMAPAVQMVTQSMTEGIKLAREFVSENEALVRGVTVFSIVYLGLVTIMKGGQAVIARLAIANKGLAVSQTEAAASAAGLNTAIGAMALNPYIIGITAVVSLCVLAAQETKEWEEKQKRLNEAIDNYNKLMEAPAAEENLQAYKDNADAAREYRQELDKIIAKQAELVESTLKVTQSLHERREAGEDKDTYARWIEENEEALARLNIVIRDADGVLKDYAQIQEELARAEAQFSGKVRETNAAIREKQPLVERVTVDTKALITAVKGLDDAYNKVAAGEKLSADEMLNLIETNKELAKFVAHTTDWQDKLKEKLKELTEEGRKNAISTLEQQNSATQITINETQARINIMMSEIRAISLVEAARLGMTKAVIDADASIKSLQEEIDANLAAIQLMQEGLSGGSKPKGGGKSKTADELAMERYQADKKAYDMQKSLREQSLDEQIEALEKLRAKYAQYADIVNDTDSQLYTLRRQKNDEWYQSEMATLEKLSRGMEERTDVEGVLQKLQELKEAAAKVYEDYPERWNTIENELDEAIIAREEDRANKIMRINANAVDELIAAQERRVSVERQMSGLVIEGVEYKFDSRQQAEAYEQSLKYLDDYIAELQSRESNLTDDEYRELQSRIKQREQYYEKIEDLHISALKEQQEAEKKAAEKELKDKTEAAKKVNQAYIASVKERYSEEIRLAEEAANAEIAIYEKRIKEIDALLKSEAREDTDASQLDRIRRLQEQLTYEIDPNNRYELEKKISQEQEDYDKRKRKETLEDERDRLKEQVNAVRDSLAERKKELQDYRDEEIRLAEESYTAYTENLKAQSEALSAKEKADTEVVKEENATRTTENKKFLEKKKEQLEVSGREERRVMNQTTSNIISDLYSRLWEFAEAGRRAGQAYAAAFQSEVSSLASSFSASSLSMSSYSGASAYSSSDNDVLYLPEPADITVNQNLNFYTPTATPSQVADAAKTGAEQLLRYS